MLESLIDDNPLHKTLLMLKNELINVQLQSKLTWNVDSKIAKQHQEYHLMEQLKWIEKGLAWRATGRASSLKFTVSEWQS